MADALDNLDTGDALAALLGRLFPLLVERAYDDARLAGLPVAFDLASPLVQGLLGSLAQDVRRISETTRREIQELVGRQAAEGWSAEQLADEIRELAGVHARARAELIARTETAAAYSRASLLAYEQSGVVASVEWLTAEDERTCPVCAPLDGQRAALGDTFAGGVAHPPAHPGCRCAISPIVEA